jgi:hypothetical protein
MHKKFFTKKPSKGIERVAMYIWSLAMLVLVVAVVKIEPGQWELAAVATINSIVFFPPFQFAPWVRGLALVMFLAAS